MALTDLFFFNKFIFSTFPYTKHHSKCYTPLGDHSGTSSFTSRFGSRAAFCFIVTVYCIQRVLFFIVVLLKFHFLYLLFKERFLQTQKTCQLLFMQFGVSAKTSQTHWREHYYQLSIPIDRLKPWAILPPPMQWAPRARSERTPGLLRYLPSTAAMQADSDGNAPK